MCCVVIWADLLLLYLPLSLYLVFFHLHCLTNICCTGNYNITSDSVCVLVRGSLTLTTGSSWVTRYPKPLVERICSGIRYEVIVWAKRFPTPTSVCAAERTRASYQPGCAYNSDAV
ncbi:hypothetical protein BD769DRAFT_699967 [Suillus cothurnatus]|nr:hypothetical protein BD769DRAFT_699967 [Suillus cothurnatus]